MCLILTSSTEKKNFFFLDLGIEPRASCARLSAVPLSYTPSPQLKKFEDECGEYIEPEREDTKQNVYRKRKVIYYVSSIYIIIIMKTLTTNLNEVTT